MEDAVSILKSPWDWSGGRNFTAVHQGQPGERGFYSLINATKRQKAPSKLFNSSQTNRSKRTAQLQTCRKGGEPVKYRNSIVIFGFTWDVVLVQV